MGKMIFANTLSPLTQPIMNIPLPMALWVAFLISCCNIQLSAQDEQPCTNPKVYASEDFTGFAGYPLKIPKMVLIMK